MKITVKCPQNICPFAGQIVALRMFPNKNNPLLENAFKIGNLVFAYINYPPVCLEKGERAYEIRIIKEEGNSNFIIFSRSVIEGFWQLQMRKATKEELLLIQR